MFTAVKVLKFNLNLVYAIDIVIILQCVKKNN